MKNKTFDVGDSKQKKQLNRRLKHPWLYNLPHNSKVVLNNIYYICGLKILRPVIFIIAAVITFYIWRWLGNG